MGRWVQPRDGNIFPQDCSHDGMSPRNDNFKVISPCQSALLRLAAPAVRAVKHSLVLVEPIYFSTHKTQKNSAVRNHDL
jgi:hypothetical protein